MKEAVLFSGRNNFNVIVDSIRQLPRRLLNAWLEATVIDENGNSFMSILFLITPCLVYQMDSSENVKALKQRF